MLFYITLFIVVLVLAKFADISEKPLIGLLAIVFVLSFVLGLRDYGVGTDTLIYPQYYFEKAQLLSIWELFDAMQEYDIGYLLLAFIANIISDDQQSMLFVTEVFLISVTVFSIYRIKRTLEFSYAVYFLLYCLAFLNPSLNLMRQTCSVSILLVGFTFLLENKWGKYFVAQIIAFFFHSSSVLFLVVPFFLFLYQTFSPKVRNIVTLLFFGSVIVAIISFYEYLQMLSAIGVISETYGDRYGETNNYSSENMYGVSYVSYIFLNYLLIWYSLKKKILSEQNQYLVLCIYTSSVVFFYTSTFITFLSRLSIYFDYIVVLYLAVLLCSKQIPIYIRTALVIVQCYMWFRLYVIAESSETIPFTSEILGIG